MKKRNYSTPRAKALDQQFRNEHEEKELIASVENENWTSISDFDFLKKRLMRDAARQRILFDSLLEKWGKVSASEAERILEERESVETEADLPPELVNCLQDKIAKSRNSGPQHV